MFGSGVRIIGMIVMMVHQQMETLGYQGIIKNRESSAAAPGATILGTFARLFVTGTHRRLRAALSVFVFPGLCNPLLFYLLTIFI